MISIKDKNWIQNAEKILTLHNSYGRYKMIALVVKGNKVLAIGKNKYLCRQAGSTLHRDFPRGVHAEMDALQSNCEKGTMYLVGETRYGTKISSKPCTFCQKLLANTKLKCIIYYEDGILQKVKPSEIG